MSSAQQPLLAALYKHELCQCPHLAPGSLQVPTSCQSRGFMDHEVVVGQHISVEEAEKVGREA